MEGGGGGILTDVVKFVPEFFVFEVDRISECDGEEVSCESSVPFVAANFEPFEAAVSCAGVCADPILRDVIEADAVFSSELTQSDEVEFGWRNDGGESHKGIDMFLRGEPVSGDSASAVGPVEAVQI